MDKTRVDIDIKYDNTEFEKLCTTVRVIIIASFLVGLTLSIFTIAFCATVMSKIFF